VLRLWQLVFTQQRRRRSEPDAVKSRGEQTHAYVCTTRAALRRARATQQTAALWCGLLVASLPNGLLNGLPPQRQLTCVRCAAACAASLLARPHTHQVVCSAAGGGSDLPVNADTLGDKAASLRNYAFASFWVQLPLTIVSACILIFALLYSKAVRAPGAWVCVRLRALQLRVRSARS
jgi:hypothetical protein